MRLRFEARRRARSTSRADSASLRASRPRNSFPAKHESDTNSTWRAGRARSRFATSSLEIQLALLCRVASTGSQKPSSSCGSSSPCPA